MIDNNFMVSIDEDNIAIVKDMKKCIQCGYCGNICKNTVTVAGMYDWNPGKNPLCIHCGQCANVCPTESIFEKKEYPQLKQVLKDESKTVIMSIAPSVRVALGEEFHIDPGINVEKRIVTALKKLGADYVFDVTFAADLTIMEEAMEFVHRMESGTLLPQFTSCCPAWIKYAEMFYPEILPNLSSCKSPMSMQGATIKSFFAKKERLDPEKIVSVMISPCTAKKYEIRRDELHHDNNFVLTTRELAVWLVEEGINLNTLEDQDFDSPLGKGTGAGVIFGNIFSEVRGMNGLKEAAVTINGTEIKIAVANGMKNAHKLLEKLQKKEAEYHLIEVMNCEGGCIAGGGQPKSTMVKLMDTKAQRASGLYEDDRKAQRRVSYKNPDIISIYNGFYGVPNSELAHKLLHTTYQNKFYMVRGE